MKEFTPAWHGVVKTNIKNKFVPASNAGALGPFGIKYGQKFTPSIRGMETKAEVKCEYDLTWWRENSFFRHDAILCSAYYGIDKWNFRKYYGIPKKDFLFVADSGGFEQLTKGVRLEPIDILKWQEKNADIGFILDVPPLDPKTLGPTGDFEFFKQCAEKTHRNTEIALRNREREDFMLYYVLQGSNMKELDFWYSGVRGCEDELDGITVSPKPPNDPMQVALLIAYAKWKEWENVHVLLGTGRETTPIIIYGSKYFNLLTFDSSSYGVGATLMKYNLPLSNEAIFFGNQFNGKVKKLPCDCPVCRVVTIEDLQRGGSIPGALISLHNLYIYTRYVNFLDSLKDDVELFTKYVRQNNSAKTVKALEFYKCFEEEEFETAYKKFFEKGKKRRLTEVF